MEANDKNTIVEFKEYPIVYVSFYDHCSGPADSTHLAVCEVIGILREETEQAYYIINWIYEQNLADSNSDCYCILKSSVVSYKQITGGKQYDSGNQKKYNRSKEALKTRHKTRLRHK